MKRCGNGGIPFNLPMEKNLWLQGIYGFLKLFGGVDVSAMAATLLQSGAMPSGDMVKLRKYIVVAVKQHL